MGVPLIWGHRGAGKTTEFNPIPENTLSSVLLAKRFHADGIECDVQLSKDGVPFIFHDGALNRLTYSEGNVTDLALKDIKRLRFKNVLPAYAGETVPTLEELLKLCKEENLLINIELKTGNAEPCGLEELVMNAVAKEGMEDKVVYVGNNHVSLIKMKEINPTAECCFGITQRLYRCWEYAHAYGMDGIHPNVNYVTVPGLLEGCRQYHMQCRFWCPDTEAQAAAVFHRGCDAVTNDVSNAFRVRENLLKQGEIPIGE